jgi:uncharacterized membrane protein YphA (DoxX/SURF4 family)
METLLWILQIALALVFLAAGVPKLFRSREQLAPKMKWVENSTDTQVKLIGAAEVLAAIGLILPAALGIVPQLTALAAVGVIFLMTGAAKTNRDHHELERVPLNVVIAVIALFVALMRFGPHAL